MEEPEYVWQVVILVEHDNVHECSEGCIIQQEHDMTYWSQQLGV